MSKMDDLRALREARYDASRPRASTPMATPGRLRAVPDRAERAEDVPELSQTELCGHRAISGRTCTRDKDHAAKSHRYS